MQKQVSICRYTVHVLQYKYKKIYISFVTYFLIVRGTEENAIRDKREHIHESNNRARKVIFYASCIEN